MKNLLLANDYSVVDRRICPPPTVHPEDLGHLLDITAERLASGGVLMLSDCWADYVRPYADSGGPQGAAVTMHAGDWSARVVLDDTWILWSRPNTTGTAHRVWTCEVDALDPFGKDSPLTDPNPMVTAMNLSDWTETTGVPWTGTPGMTGNSLLIDGWPLLSPKAAQPRWHRGAGNWGHGIIEQAYTPRQWSRRHTGPVHGYDLNMAYLSAYKVVELPADQLGHYTHDAFDPKMGGIWRVELSPWKYDHLLPDPAGYAQALPDGTRWLTTPTLTLLQQLTDRGDYGGFHIEESWTAPARRITRKWAELVHDMATAAREPLATAARQMYKQTYGMWSRSTRVYRPDWHYSIIATNRVNLWRKLDLGVRVSPMNGAQDRTLAGSTPEGAPVRVETDAVFYEAQGTWEQSAPPGFKLDPDGRKLGHFKQVKDK